MVQASCDILKNEPFLSRLKGEPVSGERGCNNCKCVVCITPEPGGIGQSGNDVEEFENRAGPAVHEQEGVWLRADTGNVQVVQVNVVQWHLELREFIEGGFLSTPI